MLEVSLVPEPVDVESLVGEAIRLNQGYADRFRYRFRHGTVWHGVLTAPCHRRRPGQPPVRTRRFV